MDRKSMERALQLEAAAKSLHRKLSQMILAKVPVHGVREEVIACGIRKPDGTLNLEYLPVPEAARRHVFRLWKREQTLRYNAMVRELNQLGMTGHGLALIPLEPPA